MVPDCAVAAFDEHGFLHVYSFAFAVGAASRADRASARSVAGDSLRVADASPATVMAVSKSVAALRFVCCCGMAEPAANFVEVGGWNRGGVLRCSRARRESPLASL